HRFPPPDRAWPPEPGRGSGSPGRHPAALAGDPHTRGREARRARPGPSPKCEPPAFKRARALTRKRPRVDSSLLEAERRILVGDQDHRVAGNPITPSDDPDHEIE